jgi:hypothetical protein
MARQKSPHCYEIALANRHLRQLKNLTRKLEDMADDWGDVDEPISVCFGDIYDKAIETRDEITGQLAAWKSGELVQEE